MGDSSRQQKPGASELPSALPVQPTLATTTGPSVVLSGGQPVIVSQQDRTRTGDRDSRHWGGSGTGQWGNTGQWGQWWPQGQWGNNGYNWNSNQWPWFFYNQQPYVAPKPSFVCPDQRPNVCAQVYQPVCATNAWNQPRTFSNACAACSDSTIAQYKDGACTVPAVTQQQQGYYGGGQYQFPWQTQYYQSPYGQQTQYQWPNFGNYF